MVCVRVFANALHRFESHMAANLDMRHSVSHEHTFDETALVKEMHRAFVTLPSGFKWAAHKGRLSEKDRNSKLSVHGGASTRGR